MRDRATAAGLHLLISVTVGGIAAVLVFVLWYPGPFRLMAGGRDLFVLVSSVDVVLGPVLTFSVFDRRKGPRHLRLDLLVIAFVQFVGLIYGLHTVYVARPVALVFEVDRFRLVRANDVVVDELPKALPPYRSLPVNGPELLGTRTPAAGEEHNDALFKGLAGVDISSRPSFWQPYEQSRAAALARSKPLAMLMKRYADRAGDLRERLSDMQADEATARFLPAVARSDWVAVLDGSGSVLGYLPVDGFVA